MDFIFIEFFQLDKVDSLIGNPELISSHGGSGGLTGSLFFSFLAELAYCSKYDSTLSIIYLRKAKQSADLSIKCLEEIGNKASNFNADAKSELGDQFTGDISYRDIFEKAITTYNRFKMV